jgi:hypothetical protein
MRRKASKTLRGRRKQSGKGGGVRLPKMPKPLRERVLREKPDEVRVEEPRGGGGDPIVVVRKGSGRKVVGAWIDI